jgi:hypothetical protein
VDDAQDLVEFAARGIPEEDLTARAFVGTGRALVATELGDAKGTRDGYTTALRLFEEQNFPIELADARVAFGRALQRLGFPDEARSEFELAREAFASMGADGLVDAIARALAELERGAGRPDPARSASG